MVNSHPILTFKSLLQCSGGQWKGDLAISAIEDNSITNIESTDTIPIQFINPETNQALTSTLIGVEVTSGLCEQQAGCRQPKDWEECHAYMDGAGFRNDPCCTMKTYFPSHLQQGCWQWQGNYKCLVYNTPPNTRPYSTSTPGLCLCEGLELQTDDGNDRHMFFLERSANNGTNWEIQLLPGLPGLVRLYCWHHMLLFTRLSLTILSLFLV